MVRKITLNTDFTAIIVLNGDIPNVEFFESIPKIPIIAADGAANKLAALNAPIDYIVGDLDSLNEFNFQEKYPNIDKIYDESQEKNDFEKCLQFAADKGLRSVLILGFQGGELEHTLNNWSVLSRYSKKMKLCVYTDGRYGIALNSSFEINLEKDETVSLIPMKKTTLKTEGLKWELDYKSLELGTREGARNKAVDGYVKIYIVDGEILLFFNARLFKNYTY